MAKISIITPVYADTPQKVEWLEEMINSVISQTFQDWELIIINDKSPVGISHATFAREDRIRWFENIENFGPAMTRNTAAALAESDCIFPLDADDVLAGPDVLEIMYNVWKEDKSKIIYGNLQQYSIGQTGDFERGKIHGVDYTFERAMNLNGLIPVTGMHSVQCWEKVGGWKKDLAEGLEDVEYWLNAGKKGFCGQRMNIITFLYRRYEGGRAYVLKHGDPERGIPVLYREMQNKIKTMHNDVFRGEFPMGCCGKSTQPSQAQSQMQAVQAQATQNRNAMVTELKGYPESELLWAEYTGPRQGSFTIAIRGPANLPNAYSIMGTGHRFQIHKRQKQFFEQRAIQGFRVNVQDPRTIQQPMPMPEAPKPQVVQVTRPELATIVSLDQKAYENEKIVADVLEAEISPQEENNTNAPSNYTLNDLNLAPGLKETLELENYTIEKLSDTTIQKLSTLPGIGIKRATRIIEKAKELINGT